jgi:ferredoxin
LDYNWFIPPTKILLRVLKEELMSTRKRGLLKGSTKNFYQEGKQTEDYSLFDFLHGYLYAKWPYLYIGVATGEHPLSRLLTPVFLLISSLADPPDREVEDSGLAWANSYHGKVVPLEEARKLVSIQEEIVIKDLEKVIPFSRAKDIILKNPDRIAALDCPCRAARENPCTPLDVCLIVGDPFVSFLLEHQPAKSRLITSQEAMEILEGEHQRGHVHHAFFKDAMLNRFYAICNCCECCCGAFQAQRSGTPMLMTSGYTAQIEPELCQGCASCVESCQFSAIFLDDGIAFIEAEKCYGCGVCVDQCDQGAVLFELDPSKGIPLEIEVLMEEARGAVE